MRLGLIGSGYVGEIVAYTAAMRGLASEIVFHDIKEERMESEAMDINDGSLFYPHRTKAIAGDYDDLASCDILVVCTGLIPVSGDRLDELMLNKDAVGNYIEEIVKRGFDGFFIVVTNPCDVIAYQVWDKSGFPKNKVIGSGTALDSVRFNVLLAEALNIYPNSVRGMMLGEHGESQFAPWSQIMIENIPFEQYMKDHKDVNMNFDKDALESSVRDRGWEIFKGKKSTQYGIANTVNQIISAIVYDNREVINVSTLMEGEYGLQDLFISTPCIIGANGVEEVIELELLEKELDKLEQSAKIIKKHIELL